MDGKLILDLVQSIILVLTLLYTIKNIRIDNYSKIIGTLNELRKHRLEHPDIEEALFPSRKGRPPEEIRTRIYAVMMANIFELSLFSKESGLIGKKEWESWETMWKTVILKEKTFIDLMDDRTIYTFSRREAYSLMLKWILEVLRKERDTLQATL